MALEFAHGAIQWLAADGVSTTYTVSGLSFQPKALRFYWIGLQSASDALSQTVNECRGVGFAVSTSSRRCVGSFSQDGAAAANCSTFAADDCVVGTTNGSTARDGELDLNAINSDGFQLIVDDAAPQDITVFWEAWGGTDITVAVLGDIAEPAATGDQDYSAAGFVAAATDQVVMFAGVKSTAALNSALAADSGICVGFATGAGADQCVLTGNSDDGSLTMDTDGYVQDGECLAMIVEGGGNPTARASLTQFGTDNFRLNWAARATTNRRYIYMALKGGQWKAGAYTIDSTAVDNTGGVSGLAFAPIGVCLMGRQTNENAAATSGTFDRFGLGTGTSTTSRRAMGVIDVNAAADANISSRLMYARILGFPDNAGAVGSGYDLSAMNSDGFTVIVIDPTSSQTAEWHGYLTFAGVAGGVAVALTGVGGAGAAGSLTVSGKANVPLTGVAGAGAAGALAVALNTPVSLPGVGSVGSPGSLAVSGKANVPVAGVAGTGAVGTLTVSAAVLIQLAGVLGTGSPGDLAVTAGMIVPITGVAASGAAGTLIGSGKATVQLTGVTATGVAGTVAAFIQSGVTIVLIGVAGVGQAGQIGVSGTANVPITGVAGIAAAGNLVAVSSVTISLPGVLANGQVGNLVISGKANVSLTGVQAQGLAGILAALAGTLQAPSERTITVELFGREVAVDLTARVVAADSIQRDVQADGTSRTVVVDIPNRTIH